MDDGPHPIHLENNDTEGVKALLDEDPDAVRAVDGCVPPPLGA